jgi:hypothetical protein
MTGDEPALPVYNPDSRNSSAQKGVRKLINLIILST